MNKTTICVNKVKQ